MNSSKAETMTKPTIDDGDDVDSDEAIRCHHDDDDDDDDDDDEESRFCLE